MYAADVSIIELLAIPLIAGLVGWSTNWLAVWMTFYPLHYRGIWPVGWQGIIPSRAERMARIVARRGVTKVGTLQEFLDGMDTRSLLAQLALASRDRIDTSVNEIMLTIAPQAWQRIPDKMQLAGYARVQSRLIEYIRNLLEYLRQHIDELVSTEEIAVTATRHDATLVNRIFQRAGAVEFRLIIRAGLWMGLLLGLLIALAWKLHPAWWVLPVGGCLLGLTTNWWALTIIFRPLYPLRVGPFTIQGVFLRRQAEVADIWGKMIGREVLTLHNILQTINESETSELARQQIVGYLANEIRAGLEEDRMLWQGLVPDMDPSAVSQLAAQRALQDTIEFMEDPEFTAPDPGNMVKLISARLAAMDPADFQDVLRPAFQEDEWKLIGIGAALGGVAGLVQYLLFAAA